MSLDRLAVVLLACIAATPFQSLAGPAREGYLDRDAAPICAGGTHQMIDSCTGDILPLHSSTLALDLELCRYLSISGVPGGPGGTVVDVGLMVETDPRCPVDCDADSLHDGCAVRHGMAPDCNVNGIPDRCDIASAASLDCNSDEVPDECQIVPCELDDQQIFLTFAARDWIAWAPERGYNSFNIYRGDLPRAGVGIDTQDPASSVKADRGCDLKGVLLRDEFIPAIGQAIFYLVTGNRFGVEDHQSINSNGTVRPHSNPCPARAAPLDVAVRTDKAVYAPREPVKIEVAVANLDPTGELTFLFGTPCKVTFRIEDLNGETVYLDLSHHACAISDTRLTLRPGQIASYAFIWDQTSDTGELVPPQGNYVIRAMLLHRDPVPDGVSGFTIRPLNGPCMEHLSTQECGVSSSGDHRSRRGDSGTGL